MFDISEFGAFISKKRKDLNMTQSFLAEKLCLTRQAISNYECGNTFPDIEVLIKFSEIFNISLDELIKSGNPTNVESDLLINCDSNLESINNIDQINNIAPLLKPNLLKKIAVKLAESDIDISNIVSLAEYLDDESVDFLLRNAKFGEVDSKLIEKLVPFLDKKSRFIIFDKVLSREVDYVVLKSLLKTDTGIRELIENAYIMGMLEKEEMKEIRSWTMGSF